MAIADAFTDTEIRCTDCDQPLYEPASRALGLGPTCRKGIRDLAHRAGPGQLALDLGLPDPSPEETTPRDPYR